MPYEPVTLQLPESGGWLPGEAAVTQKHRMFLTVQKPPKCGGTHFSLTAPGPIAYFAFDKDAGEDVLPKFMHRKQIVVGRYFVPEIVAVPRFADAAVKEELKKQNIEATEHVIKKFENDFKHWLAQPVRTIIIDTETELYEVKRFAEFGAASDQQYEYASINMWFKVLLGLAEVTDKNVILLQQTSPDYIGGNKTGTESGKGFKRTHNQVKTNVMLRNLDMPNANGVYPFELEVLNASQNTLIRGLKLQSDPSVFPLSDDMPYCWDMLTGTPEVDAAITMQDRCHFAWLAKSVFPNTKLEDWV